jgi:hypothetical protein
MPVQRVLGCAQGAGSVRYLTVSLMDGVLQIVPHDNHHLLQRLRSAVESLLATAANLPAFAMWPA